MRKLTAVPLALLCLLLAMPPSAGGAESSVMSARVPSETAGRPITATFSLDGVALELATSFLSDLSFVTSDPYSAIQMATAVERAPRFRELSITAVPYGASPPTESLPLAGAGREQAYRAALRAYREGQGGRPRRGAAMRLFGEEVVGLLSVVNLRVRGSEPAPVAVAEWVVEAGERLWIVRASWEMESRAARQPSATSPHLELSHSALSSQDLTRPSTSLTVVPERVPMPPQALDLAADSPDLPSPMWWAGECDTINFRAETGAAAYPLGAEYRGLKACGPRPYADGGPWRWVDFGAGVNQIEWQCPELSKRFLYLAYGLPPYPANGNQVVTNYDGDLLEKVWNCTAGRAPQPDDVLSYGATSTYGHTSVVASSDVDETGNGTIRVIEQNSSRDGYSTLYVDDWCVRSYSDVIGWLHYPGWLVEYYSDESLTDACATEARDGTYLFEAWGDDGPADACPSYRFGARFSRTVDFPGGDYTFALGYDGHARLMVDGEIVIDGWGSADQHYEMQHLEGGQHRVSVEYYHPFGDAALTVFWWGPGFELMRESRDSSQWYAEYWGNPALWWDPVVTMVDGDGPLRHDWSWGAPADSLPVDRFSSRFRRIVSFDAGRWRFNLFADDGVRLWIDDQLVVDEWQPQRAWFTPTVTMGGGDHELVVEHYENEEVADVELDWERVSEAITPTVWVSSPLHGDVIETCPVTIEAQVTDEVGAVDRVEFHAFYDNGWHHLGDDDASPYSFDWACLLADDQTVSLTAHVWDEEGREFVDLNGHVAVGFDLNLQSLYLPLVLHRDAGDF